MEKIKHYSLVVQGRVQGVGYRAFTARAAQKFGVKGFVKNKPNRSVQIEAEGDVEFLEQFVNLCRKGPGWAHVDSVSVSESPVSNFNDFRIRY